MSISPVIPACTFGNLFYFKLLMQPTVVIDIGEHYLKQTWRNRYDIVAANGLLSLTVPVVGQRGQKIPVRDIEVDFTDNWQALHWKTITSAYASAPFFEYYADELQSFYENVPASLAELNINSMRLMLRWLRMEIDLNISQAYHTPTPEQTDLRPNFKPSKFPLNDFGHPSYFQVFSHKHPFFANVSILDLVFNLGPEASQHLQRIPLEESQIINLAAHSKSRYGRN